MSPQRAAPISEIGAADAVDGTNRGASNCSAPAPATDQGKRTNGSGEGVGAVAAGVDRPMYIGVDDEALFVDERLTTGYVGRAPTQALDRRRPIEGQLAQVLDQRQTTVCLGEEAHQRRTAHAEGKADQRRDAACLRGEADQRPTAVCSGSEAVQVLDQRRSAAYSGGGADRGQTDVWLEGEANQRRTAVYEERADARASLGADDVMESNTGFDERESFSSHPLMDGEDRGNSDMPESSADPDKNGCPSRNYLAFLSAAGELESKAGTGKGFSPSSRPLMGGGWKGSSDMPESNDGTEKGFPSSQPLMGCGGKKRFWREEGSLRKRGLSLDWGRGTVAVGDVDVSERGHHQSPVAITCQPTECDAEEHGLGTSENLEDGRGEPVPPPPSHEVLAWLR